MPATTATKAKDVDFTAEGDEAALIGGVQVGVGRVEGIRTEAVYDHGGVEKGLKGNVPVDVLAHCPHVVDVARRRLEDGGGSG